MPEMPLRIRMKVIDVTQKLNSRGYATEQQITLRAVQNPTSDSWSVENPPEAVLTMNITVPEAFDSVRNGQLVNILIDF